MLVIPAVDIKAGKCVRLRQGRADAVTVFDDDPVAAAKRWEAEGAEYLHVVDLDGAFEGKPANLAIVKQIIKAVKVKVEVGGGIRTDADVEELLGAGADRVIIGTKAAESFDWVKALIAKHPRRVAIGVDVKDGFVAVRGWVETSALSPFDLLDIFGDCPVAAYIYTDVLRDGIRTGPNLDATRDFASEASAPVIASGGVSSLDDLRALAKAGIHGAICGRALYDGAFTLAEAIAAAKA